VREIVTEIEIDSPAERVWEVLTDFAAYPQWNPFIRRAEGELREGARLEIRIEPPGGRGMTFRPVLLEVRRPTELRWLGRLGLRGLFDGEHVFSLEPLDRGGVRLVHRERFTGLLVPLLWRPLERSTREGFESMNGALRSRAEDPTWRS
jgi:hypothetical protein